MVVGYARASSTSQRITIGKQRKKIEEFCERKDFELESFYSNQVSGRKSIINDSDDFFEISFDKRPELYAAFQEAQEIGEDLVIYNSSRLARNVHYQGLIEEGFKKSGVDISYVEGFERRILRRIMGVIDEEEVERTIERTKDALRRKKENDEWVGRPPVGFRSEKDSNDNATGFLVKDQPLYDSLKCAEEIYEETDRGYKTTADKVREEFDVDVQTHQVRSFINRNREKIQRFLKQS